MSKTEPDHVAYIGIGSNLGQRIRALEFARRSLITWSQEVVCSPVYETGPVGYTNQPDFLNMVARIHTDLSAEMLLDNLLAVETAYGRERTIRFGPRTLDMDVLLYDQARVSTERLQIPHPRMWERGFVVIPLFDLDPTLNTPMGPIVDVAKHYQDKGDVRYVGRFW